MVLSVVRNEGDVMHHTLFAGLRISGDGCVDVLAAIVKPWIESVSKGRPYVFQQDLPPVHTACVTQ